MISESVPNRNRGICAHVLDSYTRTFAAHSLATKIRARLVPRPAIRSFSALAVQVEIHCNFHLHGDWLIVFLRWFVLPFLHGNDRVFVKSVAEPFDYLRIDHVAFFVHHNHQRDGAFNLFLLCLSRVIRGGNFGEPRWGDIVGDRDGLIRWLRLALRRALNRSEAQHQQDSEHQSENAFHGTPPSRTQSQQQIESVTHTFQRSLEFRAVTQRTMLGPFCENASLRCRPRTDTKIAHPKMRNDLRALEPRRREAQH